MSARPEPSHAPAQPCRALGGGGSGGYSPGRRCPRTREPCGPHGHATSRGNPQHTPSIHTQTQPPNSRAHVGRTLHVPSDTLWTRSPPWPFSHAAVCTCRCTQGKGGGISAAFWTEGTGRVGDQTGANGDTKGNCYQAGGRGVADTGGHPPSLPLTPLFLTLPWCTDRATGAAFVS